LPDVSYAVRAAYGVSQCGRGSDWSCVGHVTWHLPKSDTVTFTADVEDWVMRSSPVAGAEVAVCGADDPYCATPLGKGRTDDAGSVSLQVPQVRGPRGLEGSLGKRPRPQEERSRKGCHSSDRRRPRNGHQAGGQRGPLPDVPGGQTLPSTVIGDKSTEAPPSFRSHLADWVSCLSEVPTEPARFDRASAATATEDTHEDQS
jgi:hypothetical protein